MNELFNGKPKATVLLTDSVLLTDTIAFGLPLNEELEQRNADNNHDATPDK